MQPNESIENMFIRFSDITNNLQSLGKSFSQSDLVRKNLRSLTLEWEKKTTAIEEAKGISNYSLEERIGNITSYEVQMIEKEIEKVLERKNITFNASIESDDSDDEDFAFITNKFKLFLKKERIQKKDKRKTKKKKALQATWDDSDTSDEDGEVAHSCFMATLSEVLSLDNIEDFSFNELLDAFNELYMKYKSLIGKNKSINKNFMDISHEKGLISNENEKLRNKNKAFKLENDILKNELNIMKSRFDMLENNIASLKVKSENLLIDVRKKTLDRRKYRSVPKNSIPYENSFIRPKNNESYEFVMKKENKNKWIPKMRNNKTNPFGPKIM